jgi:2-hydroxychromene-2-carboxylate isomerase
MATDATFYFDFVSPYAYLAAMRIDEVIPEATWKPIAFPFLLHEVGRLDAVLQRDPSAALEALEEARRRAAERGLPRVNPPEGWPNEIWSIATPRAALFADEGGRLREFAHAAYAKQFVEGRSVGELGTLLEAGREAGLDPDAIKEGIARQDIKDRLKQNTDEAVARGVKGIPTVATGDELFWGEDRLEEAAAAAATTTV